MAEQVPEQEAERPHQQERNDEIVPIYLGFREDRGQQAIAGCPRFLLIVLRCSLSFLGLWGNQCWNWLPRILFLVISFYQVVYRMYIDFDCPNFNCHFKPNLTSDKTLHGVVATGQGMLFSQ